MDLAVRRLIIFKRFPVLKDIRVWHQRSHYPRNAPPQGDGAGHYMGIRMGIRMGIPLIRWTPSQAL
eukprot:1181120-Prorocentrum_minimum.AAC.1